MSSQGSGRRPILVTGGHRCGTSFLGRMLCLGDDAHYVHEPFNPRMQPSWLSPPVGSWYHHLPIGSADGPTVRGIDRTVALRYPLNQVTALRSLRHGALLMRDAAAAHRARLAGRRAVVKDPIMLLSAEWFADRYHAPVVITIRHPAAFVSSVLRLGWTFDVGHWLRQPSLRDDLLAPWAGELARADRSADPLGDAVLIWRVLHGVIAGYRDRHPDWIFVRNEDLSDDPAGQFQTLYRQLGLTWTGRVAAALRRYTGSANSAELPVEQFRRVDRDSRAAARTWQHRLDTGQLSRIRTESEPEATAFYGPADWVHDEVAAR